MKHMIQRSAFFVMLFTLLALASSLRAQEPVEVTPTTADGYSWYDATQWPVENQGWKDVDRYFARFPSSAKGVIRDSVWTLSQHSAGLVVRFRTNATEIKVRYTLYENSMAMPHMPATGKSGLDLYAYDEQTKTWRWAAVTQPTKKEDEKTWLSGLDGSLRNYMVYLPLYNGIDALSIGVPEAAEFTALSPRSDKPIVYYGTSIAHGGCASRPGNAYTAMLGRRLDVPVINLGFSGNAHSEIEIAELLSQLDPVIYVLDPVPNMTANMVAERIVPFVNKLREAHPTTPILLVEDRYFSNSWIVPAKAQGHEATHAELRKAYETLKENDPNLYYLDASNQLGEEFDDDGTVDSSHPNDLGMWRMTNALEEVLRPILEDIRKQ